MNVPKRSLMLLNSTFRVSYGVGALLAPAQMAKLQLAADTTEQPAARLFVRGFGAHQIAVAALGLASRRWRALERPAALAAITIDVAFHGAVTGPWTVTPFTYAMEHGEAEPYLQFSPATLTGQSGEVVPLTIKRVAAGSESSAM